MVQRLLLGLKIGARRGWRAVRILGVADWLQAKFGYLALPFSVGRLCFR